MQGRMDAGLVRCRTGRMQDMVNVGCTTGGMQNRRLQDRTDVGQIIQDVCTFIAQQAGQMHDRQDRCRTGRMQDRMDAGQDGCRSVRRQDRPNVGQGGCKTEQIQDRTDAGQGG